MSLPAHVVWGIASVWGNPDSLERGGAWMEISDVVDAGVESRHLPALRQYWVYIQEQVLLALDSSWKVMATSRVDMKRLMIAVVLLMLALLSITLKLGPDYASPFSSFLVSSSSSSSSSSSLAKSPSWFSRFSGYDRPKVRMPNDMRPRRMQRGEVLSSAFLRETINASKIDLNYGEVRLYKPYGVGTHLFLHFSTYRRGPREFATTGSIGRGVEDWLHPQFGCSWVDANGTAVESREVQKHFPLNFDVPNFMYRALVVICVFEVDVGTHGDGGTLSLNFWKNDKFRLEESLVALTEAPGDYKGAESFEPPFPYDVVYCGSPVYGNVSAERMREWLAYHMFVMGDGAHFILYDAGGFHETVQRVLAPWVALGRVSVQSIRQMDLYNAYYFHQHTVVNDCLYKSQFLANWTFFFDIDEYLYVDPVHGLNALLQQLSKDDITLIKYDQKPMSITLCPAWPALLNDTRDALLAKMWGFEKFIFNMHWPGETHSNKYAVQGRHMLMTEVHGGDLKRGGDRYLNFYDGHLWFHHFHGFLTEHGEGCRDYTDAAAATWDSPVNYDNQQYSADYTIANLADDIKQFEISKIGTVQPFIL